MEHKPNHRRTIPPASSSDPPINPSSSMDPTCKKHPTSRTSHPTNPDSSNSRPSKVKSFYYMTNHHLSRLNLNRTTQNPPPPPSKDIHLPAKSLTVSADFAPRKVKEGRREMVKKSSSKTKQVLDCKKLVLLNDNYKDVKKKKDDDVDDVKRVSVSSLGRRRSFCGGGSQVELADVRASCGVKVVSVDMPPFMQIHAFTCARKTYDSLEKFTAKALALTLKKEFDEVYGPAWHCIVGTSFGSFVTHSVGGFLYFSMDQKMYVLLFKTTVQRAD